MSKPGDDLQRLVRLLELAVAANERISVHSPLMMKDRDTGQMREHDVVVEVEASHHKLIIALECRDRSRKVTVPEVEAFSDKCRATGVDQGILVSTKGFTATALSKARARSIRCLTFEEVRELDWMAAKTLPVVHRNIRGVFLQLGFDEQPPKAVDHVLLDGKRASIGRQRSAPPSWALIR